ncbi:hypothetical protein [Chengkuizengella axinellae]|uniref:50S ribosomal protein L35 n=1 Tax=Chengkuizengella axinellae TaxID=3064388 RepID=A0ABT9J627_9BACL|nr:hypothetical protein [Chengkuizengella sp. 2205SS18-9]MDP5277044.1 hypothetical protein [Chengkuizengella sp. 2205SS18-9]
MSRTPIRTSDIKRRALKKLANRNHNSNHSKYIATGQIVKTVHVNKDEPLVKKIMGFK